MNHRAFTEANAISFYMNLMEMYKGSMYLFYSDGYRCFANEDGHTDEYYKI